jgi:DNA-binding LytR/AlgR family response regulator
MNVIIVDDDEVSRCNLKHFVEQVSFLKLIKVCHGPLEAIDTLKEEKVDLAFVDIQMPEMNGIELIKSLTIKPLVILTTSNQKFAVEAFENNVVDYLVKPLTLSRFMKAVAKAVQLFDSSVTRIGSQKQDYFFVKKNSVMYKLYVKDIFWVEALGDYVTIHTKDDNYTLHTTLKAIEAKLPSDKFVRAHKSFIVAVNNIATVEETTIYINGKQIPVGAMYRDGFMKALNLL